MTTAREAPLPAEVRAAADDLGLAVTESVQLTGGRAARTYRVATSDGNAILRVESETGPTTGVALTTRHHYDLLASLVGHGALAPTALGTGSVPAGDYLLTSFLDGDVPSPWSRQGRGVLGAEPLRSNLPQQCAAALRAVHAVPLAVVRGVGPAASTVRPADELDRWRAVLESTSFKADPLITWCLFRVERDLPDTVRAALVHGDFRLGNLVVRDGALAGVLDWELATVGDPALDLALLLAPPVSADWHRCGLDPVSTVVDHYLQGRPDADEIRDRLPALTLLATLKVVSLWVNGSRSGPNGVTADAARCGLNALGARRYLAGCLRADHLAPPGPAGSPGPRGRWKAEVAARLSELKSAGRWDGALLSDDLAFVPAGDHAQGRALTAAALHTAETLGLAVDSSTADPVLAVSALVHAYAKGSPDQDPADDRVVEDLVLRTLAPELEPLPW